MEHDEAREAFRLAWAEWRAAQDKADAAFVRYFTRLQAGERTNAAQATRLQNAANYLSADLAVAAGALYRAGIDPTEVVPDYTEI